MSDDDRLRQRLLKQAQAYARLYPSIVPRLKAAFEAGDRNVAALAQAMSQALDQADGHRERQLRDAWGLSPKEIGVTLHLVDGGTVATCAAALGVAESTVRTHLKSVFGKTGCNRQAQLASLLQNNSEMSDFDKSKKD
ncbi:MAG: helix-turn-helix transcriptional regulator [Pseudomonadota bacterium]